MSAVFDRWEWDARIALGDRGVGYHVANPYIEEARRHCDETGESPYEAFGPPQEYAAATAVEVPESLRENVDRYGMSTRDYLTGGPFLVGVIMILWSLFGGFVYQQWSFAVTPARVIGAVLFALTYATVFKLPPALRAAGRPRLVPAGFALAGLLLVATAYAFVELPKTALFTAPVLGLTAIGVLLCWLSTRPAKPPVAAPPVSADDADGWYRRLHGVLVGRHDLTPQRATELVTEAREHATEAAATPAAEFGDVDGYAARLAEHEPVRREAWWRRRWARIAVAAAAIAITINFARSWLDSGYAWVAYGICVPAAIGLVWELVKAIRSPRR